MHSTTFKTQRANGEKKIVVCLSGASGAIYAKQLLDVLVPSPHRVAIVASEHAKQIWVDEVGGCLEQYDCPLYAVHDFTAPFASGSNVWDACVIVPCSMGMLGRIAHGMAEDLIARCGDVFLKERRPLLLVPRETPFTLIHLDNMRALTLAGATILPASPSFYGRPRSIEEAVDTVVARIVDHLGIAYQPRTKRWGAER
ncbi:MAG: UbiX family flavin prenyltransferase [Deltaproteobacteria bacterium]|nr:UbiX family flavin prenyltransferase [Deltaproteobacteria bacterium]